MIQFPTVLKSQLYDKGSINITTKFSTCTITVNQDPERMNIHNDIEDITNGFTVFLL